MLQITKKPDRNKKRDLNKEREKNI